MNLLPEAHLKELVRAYPGLTQPRRELLVDFLKSFTPAECDELLKTEGSMPPDEMAFVEACFGILRDTPRVLASLHRSDSTL